MRYVLLLRLYYPNSPAEKTYTELCGLLKTHFVLQKCVFRERAKFYNTKQGKN